MNATNVYKDMLEDIASAGRRRETTDAESPARGAMLEASFNRSYTLLELKDNVVRCRKIDGRWARANLLHFFAATEDAGVLRRYNRCAERFLTGDRLVGAYGPTAVPQIEECIALLRHSPQSRRAVVSMGGLRVQDLNQPPCWSFLHFMEQADQLHLAVYQRSLNVTGVMPYDCVLLTNVLLYAAERLNVLPGRLHWTVGNLHAPSVGLYTDEVSLESIVYPASVLGDPQLCTRMLEEGL